MQLQNYAEELMECVRTARQEAEKVNLIKKAPAEIVYVQHEGQTFYNPKYLTVGEYYEIFELKNFLENNGDITNEELSAILSTNIFYFGFLRKLLKAVPNLVELIKVYDAKFVAETYVNYLLFPKKDNNFGV